MRTAAKRDANEREIIEALLLAGATVRQLNEHAVPDLIVGYQGRNFLLEVKTPAGKLNDDQFAFFEDWNGQVEMVRTPEEALKAIGAGNEYDSGNDDDGPPNP